MTSIINIGIEDFLKSLWIDAKKFIKILWFKINFKLVNFGFDNAYKKRFSKNRLYCFVCWNDKNKIISLSRVTGYGEWDHKCKICERTFNMHKENKVDCYKYKRN